MIRTNRRILADSSIWIDHFRQPNLQLRTLLSEGHILMHPMIWGEVACGSLPRRSEILKLLKELPHLEVLSDEHVHYAIESRHWWSKGIGWVDAHLLTSSIASGAYLWTMDKRLEALSVKENNI